MSDEIRALAALVRELQQAPGLEPMLRIVVDGAAALLEVPRVSLRLLDPSRTRLIAACRAGEPLHVNPMTEFRLGEGLMGWIAERGAPIRTDHAASDPRFAPRPDILEPPTSFVGVPLLSGTTCFGVLSAVDSRPAWFTQHHEDLLTLIAGLCAPYLEIARLTRLTQLDALTGVLNRRGLDLAFQAALPRDAAAGAPLAVLMVDIDHFKRVNDALGHAAGDQALRRIAALLTGFVRGGDGVVRYGGEEFLLVLPGADLPQARRTAERLRDAVETTRLPSAVAGAPLTISVGVAARRDGESRDGLIERADAALYAAKQAGRNRVEVASS